MFGTHRASKIGREDRLFETTALELLEKRVLLSGNVSVLINSLGDITLRGDGRSNYLEIAREVVDQNGDGDTTDVVIRGLPDTTGVDTLLRSGRQVISQLVLDADHGEISGKLTVNLGGGHDFLVLRGVQLANDFTYSAGGGHDSLGVFDDTHMSGLARIRTASGNDYLNFVDASVAGTLDVDTSSGVDFIGLSEFSLAAGAQARFITGSGADILYVEESDLMGDVYVDTGSLIDTLYVAAGTRLSGRVDVNLGTQFDLLVIENQVDLTGAIANVDGGGRGYYQNQVFLYADSPFYSNRPNWLRNFETDPGNLYYTTSGVSTYVGLDMSTTLTKWLLDLYYSYQPTVTIDVIDTLIAANMARGFQYEDLPRSHLGPAPDPVTLASEVQWFLAQPSFYGYQKLFMRQLFDTEIRTFGWANYTG